MVNTLDIPIRLASLLLMSRAQITMSEIKSLPFVNNEKEADAVAQNLMGMVSPGFQIKAPSSMGQGETKLILEMAAEPRPGQQTGGRPPHGRGGWRGQRGDEACSPSLTQEPGGPASPRSRPG